MRVDLSLLPEGTYAVELFRDGENAARILEHLLDRIELLLVDEPRFEQIGRKLHADLMLSLIHI